MWCLSTNYPTTGLTIAIYVILIERVETLPSQELLSISSSSDVSVSTVSSRIFPSTNKRQQRKLTKSRALIMPPPPPAVA
ncbi:hypothetical protein DOY81_014418 [Sarcophaga bullata]|nr:hypothetical protein DOY81_014418 [Sarcophaga bullata]